MKDVTFVGAGPGAADLITVRGSQMLSQAGMIIYAGSLVNPDLLQYAGKDCKIYDSASMTLDEVIEAMQAGVKEKRAVVRLHTGDPSIYGAIREQMDRLDELGLSYEVVPGVSSFSAAAAALNAEYTLPSVSQTVILTRMEGRTPVPEGQDIASLAAHKASMAIFLSAGMLEKLAERLIEGGYSMDTPAALVYKASWPEQKTVRTTLAGLAEAGKKEGISKTALVLVGGFLGDEYELSRLYAPDFTHEFRQAKE